jgi:hypothetical protein
MLTISSDLAQFSLFLMNSNRKKAGMMIKKHLCCYLCSKQAKEEEERPGMACCPIHGWMPLQFFEVCEGIEDLSDEKQEEESGE